MYQPFGSSDHPIYDYVQIDRWALLVTGQADGMGGTPISNINDDVYGPLCLIPVK